MGKLIYRQDKHLAFLKNQDNKTLEVLIDIMIKDQNGNLRASEDLTLQDRYKEYTPDHSKYWDLVAAEYQYYGANTIVSIFRKKGVLYEEVLHDVCNKMKVNLPKNHTVEIMENNLLMKTVEKALNNMSEEERKEWIKDLNINTTNFSTIAIMTAIQSSIRMSGFFAYQFAVVIANSIAKTVIGTGLSFAANATITRTIAIFSGPIGWVITGALTGIQLAEPAYRITIPATIYIAALRQAELNKQAFELDCPNCGKPIHENNASFCPACGIKL